MKYWISMWIMTGALSVQGASAPVPLNCVIRSGGQTLASFTVEGYGSVQLKSVEWSVFIDTDRQVAQIGISDEKYATIVAFFTPLTERGGFLDAVGYTSKSFAVRKMHYLMCEP